MFPTRFSTLFPPLGPAVLPLLVVTLAGAAAATPVTVPATIPVIAPAFGPTIGLEPGAAPQNLRDDGRVADRKRVLELADRTLLRARTRYSDGRWEQRVGRDWVPVAGAVVGHSLESDLLSRARAMGAEVGRDEHGERAVLADWMVRKGLAAEALAELDRILADAPEHAAAIEVLRERDFPLSVLVGDGDPTLGEFLVAGAQGSSAVQEALVWRLARLPDRSDVEAIIESQLLSPQYRRRAFGALAARRLARGPLQKPLTDRAVLDTMGIVREQAARALGDLEDPQAIAPVVDALGSRFVGVRRNAAEALGNAGYAAAVAPLMAHLAHLQSSGQGSSGVRANLFVGFQTAYVGDYDVEIAQGSSIADPQVMTQSSGVVFDVRAQAQITRTVTLLVEKRAVTDALHKLTGLEEPRSDAAWLEWWEENRGRWMPVEPAAPATEEGG